MKKTNVPIFIEQEELDASLCKACQFNDLEQVKYLLTSNELSQHADISCCKNAPLRNACSGGYIDIINYLLFSPDLNRHSSIHENNDSLFNHLLEYEGYNIINYFIFQLNIEKTQHIEKLLTCYPKKRVAEVQSWFHMRELNSELKNALDNEKVVEKKLKI
jgi:hypothetical protein